MIISDEFQIPLRKIKIQKSGSDGGHNGLKSVLECFNTLEIPRFRVGVGPLEPEGVDPAKFVLERFNSVQRNILDQLMPKLVDIAVSAINDGIDVAMNQYNGIWLV